MIGTFFQKSIETCSTKHDAVSAGLIGMDELDSDECYMAVEIANREKIPIPERFLKEMTNDMLFSDLPRKEVAAEILSRARKDDFELPDLSRWAKKYDIPVKLQRQLIPHFIKLPRRILKRWKQNELDDAVAKEIVSIRIKEGRLKAKNKEDPLLVAIRNNDSHHLGYFGLDKLIKERFLSVLEQWLKANDEIKAQIFKTSHVNLLSKEQYLDILKSWLNHHSYSNDLERLSMDDFRELSREYQYKALEKYINGSIKNISPMPPVDEVKQIILPKLFSERDEAEKLFLQYKTRFLYCDLRQNAVLGKRIDNYFNEREVDQLRVIKKGFTGSYYPAINELKLRVELYEWILNLNGNKRAALCNFFTRG